jgi:hypothetical protein
MSRAPRAKAQPPAEDFTEPPLVHVNEGEPVIHVGEPGVFPTEEGVSDEPATDPDPEPSPVEADAQPDEPPLQLADGWNPMETAPLDGKPVYLAGWLEAPGVCVPAVCPAYHHKTRRWRGSAMRWVETAWWVVLNYPPTTHPVPFKPLAWQRYQ